MRTALVDPAAHVIPPRHAGNEVVSTYHNRWHNHSLLPLGLSAIMMIRPKGEMMLDQRDFQIDVPAEAVMTSEPCSLVASFSEVTGIITVTGHGEWTEALVRRHFAALEKLIAEVRASGRPVLALVDLRQAENQQESIAALAAREANRVHGKDDRIAIMASSSLMKMRMKEAASKSQREFFLSENAALTWLTAHHRN